MGDEASAVNVQSRELLPTNVVPRHYHVTLETNFEKFTFDGTVAIDLDVAEDSKSVSLHTLELDIHSAKITSDGKTVRLGSPPPQHGTCNLTNRQLLARHLVRRGHPGQHLHL